MAALTRNHPCETLHRSTNEDLPTQQATIEWIIANNYLATGNHRLAVRHLVKAAEWLDRAGAPVQAAEIRAQVLLLSTNPSSKSK